PTRDAGPREGHFDQGKMSGAWSSANRLSNWVSSPIGSLLRPPLPEPALLPEKTLSLTVAVPKFSMPPPGLVAGLSAKVLSLTANVLRNTWPPRTRPRLKMPPPSRAELPAKVLSLTVIVTPPLLMPPPWPTAELSVKVLSITTVGDPLWL